MKRWTLAITLIAALAAAGCSNDNSADALAATSTPATATTQATTTKATPTRVVAAADSQAYLDSIGKFMPELLMVQPLEQADWICRQFDIGATPEPVKAAILVRLQRDYADVAPSKYFEWDEFEAGVLVVDAARYYCSEHADKIPA